MSRRPVHVGVELGGTKIVVGASAEDSTLVSRAVIKTGDPVATFDAILESIGIVADHDDVAAIGIASFGPIDLRTGSATHGEMMQTPKPGWSGVDVLAGLAVESVPSIIDTDVNAAMLAERVWGVGTSEDVAYFTVGTGIGGAVWTSGGVLHGANHSEIGHIRVPRHPDDDFLGSCPFHGDCLEGMASGTAIERRWGVSADTLGAKAAAALELEAWYLAHAIASLSAVIPVEQVIIGGGVSKMAGFHASVSAVLSRASGGYPAVPFATGGPEVVAPGLGDNAGVVGAIELARSVSVA
jgi:fructokinase